MLKIFFNFFDKSKKKFFKLFKFQFINYNFYHSLFVSLSNESIQSSRFIILPKKAINCIAKSQNTYLKYLTKIQCSIIISPAL